MLRNISIFALVTCVFLNVACSCQTKVVSQFLDIVRQGDVKIKGLQIGLIFSPQGNPLPVLVDNSKLNICSNVKRQSAILTLNFQGPIISNIVDSDGIALIWKSSTYYRFSRYVCDFKRGNSLKLNLIFTFIVDSSKILGLVTVNQTYALLSIDKKSIFFYNSIDGKLVDKLVFKRPTIWYSHSSGNLLSLFYGFDGNDFIMLQYNDKNNHKESKIHVNDNFSLLDNAFFPEYDKFWNWKLDLYDGLSLWRIYIDPINLNKTKIYGPLKINNLKKSFNQSIYPYENGLCYIKNQNDKQNDKLELQNVDFTYWKPLQALFSTPTSNFVNYYLFMKHENGQSLIRIYKITNGNKIIIEVRSTRSIETEIIDSFLMINHNSTMRLFLYSQKEIFIIDNPIAW